MGKKIKRKIIAILLLALALSALLMLKGNAYISEYIFSRGIARFYLAAVGAVTSLLPFSLYEILVAAAVALLIAFIVKSILRLKRRHFAKLANGFASLAVIVLSVIVLYNMTASFAYSRQSADLKLSGRTPEKEQVPDIAYHFLQDFNSLAESLERDGTGSVVVPYTFGELSTLCKVEFSRLEGDFFNSHITDAKPLLLSPLVSYFGITGVFFAPTSEPNINTNSPNSQLAVTMLHEMAHSSGVMRENEANLIAYYLALSSENDFIRYSGYMATMGQMSAAVLYTAGNKAYQDFYGSYSDKIVAEQRYNREFWSDYSSVIDDVSSFFNDLYLKLSGIKEGVSSYHNDYEIIDSGEQDEQGEPIFEIHYSLIQRIYFTVYYGADA